MPSDAKKKQQQKKKEAAKARQSGKKPQSNNQTRAAEDGKEQSPTSRDLQNGTNGTAISVEGEPEEFAVLLPASQDPDALASEPHFDF